MLYPIVFPLLLVDSEQLGRLVNVVDLLLSPLGT